MDSIRLWLTRKWKSVAFAVVVIFIGGCLAAAGGFTLTGCFGGGPCKPQPGKVLCGYCSQDRLTTGNPHAGTCRSCDEGYVCSGDICGELKCIPASQTPPIPTPLTITAVSIPAEALNHNLAGVTLSKAGKADEAMAEFDRAVALAPNYASPYTNRGLIYIIRKQYPAAIQEFNISLAIDGRYALAYSSRAIANLELEQYDQALADLNTTTQLDPNDAEAWNNKGVAQQALGNTQEAAASYDKALTLNPRNPEAGANKASLLGAKAGGQPATLPRGRISPKTTYGDPTPVTTTASTGKAVWSNRLQLDLSQNFSYELSESSRRTGNALPAWPSGGANSHQLRMTGGTAPYSWQYQSTRGLLSSAITDGINFDSRGYVSGTAAQLGTSIYRSLFVTAVVTDSSNPPMKTTVTLLVDIVDNGKAIARQVAQQYYSTISQQIRSITGSMPAGTSMSWAPTIGEPQKISGDQWSTPVTFRVSVTTTTQGYSHTVAMNGKSQLTIDVKKKVVLKEEIISYSMS
jgi:Tfp pilus assembly protein PilF